MCHKDAQRRGESIGRRISGGASPWWPEMEEHDGGRANSGEKIGQPLGDLDGAFGGK